MTTSLGSVARSRQENNKPRRQYIALFASTFLVLGIFASLLGSSSIPSTGVEGLSGYKNTLLSAAAGYERPSWASYVPGRFRGSQSPSLRLAIIVKTGATTAYQRLPYHVFDIGDSGATFPGPIQQAATLKPNIHLARHFVSDHSMQLGSERVVDVLRNVSSRFGHQVPFARYPLLHSELSLGRLPQQGDAYHHLDRYKFLAMHEYVYNLDPTADFQLAMDDDTVMFYPALARWLAFSGFKADDYHYLGTRKGEMADGGAGYLLSRSVLQALFNSSYEVKGEGNGKVVPLSQREDVIKGIGETWCGDCSLAGILGEVLRDKLPEHRLTGGGWR